MNDCTQESHDAAIADPERWEAEFRDHVIWPDAQGESAQCRRCNTTRLRAIAWVEREDQTAAQAA